MKSVIAIDGPAGSGKGTLARRIASHFHFIYLDTGKLYRTVAYINKSVEELEKLSITEIIDTSENIKESELRSEKNSIRTAVLAKNLQIREIMTRLQRDFADYYKDTGTVLDGRDIGTVVFPDAYCKLFITADLEVRARRRFEDLQKINSSVLFEDVLNQMKNRDEQDMNRTIAPLKYDESYYLVDTTKKTEEESLLQCIDIINQCSKFI